MENHAASETGIRSGRAEGRGASRPGGRLRTDGGSDHHARPHSDHAHHHDAPDDLGIAVVTVSSTRTFEDDPAGERVIATLENAGHEVPIREVVDDDYDGVQSTVERLAERKDVDAVVTSGGTGVTPDDVTVEAIRPLFEKELPGFGELFRTLSREEVGTRVVATRATAGVVDHVPVFVLPGSENAVVLGVEEVILPEVGHLVSLATRE